MWSFAYSYQLSLCFGHCLNINRKIQSWQKIFFCFQFHCNTKSSSKKYVVFGYLGPPQLSQTFLIVSEYLVIGLFSVVVTSSWYSNVHFLFFETKISLELFISVIFSHKCDQTRKREQAKKKKQTKYFLKCSKFDQNRDREEQDSEVVIESVYFCQSPA